MTTMRACCSSACTWCLVVRTCTKLQQLSMPGKWRVRRCVAEIFPWTRRVAFALLHALVVEKTSLKSRPSEVVLCVLFRVMLVLLWCHVRVVIYEKTSATCTPQIVERKRPWKFGYQARVHNNVYMYTGCWIRGTRVCYSLRAA